MAKEATRKVRKLPGKPAPKKVSARHATKKARKPTKHAAKKHGGSRKGKPLSEAHKKAISAGLRRHHSGKHGAKKHTARKHTASKHSARKRK